MTRPAILKLLGCLTVLLLLTLPLRPAEEDRGTHAYAVLIGAGKYADAAIKTRPHAEDDAQALCDLFTDPNYLGVPKDHVRLLLGPAATRDNILAAARWVAAEAKPDDLVLFAYVGQGAALGERGDRLAYFAADSDVKDPARTAVLATALGDELDKLRSRRACFFVDVCFKGYTPARGGVPADPNPGEDAFFAEFLGKDKNQDAATAPGRVLFLADGGRFASPDAGRHGTFAQVVLDGLRGKADTEGGEPDGVVTVDELIDYVDKELPARVKERVADEKQRPQHDVLADEDAHFVLTGNPAVEPKVRERLKKFAALAGGGNKLTPEMAREGKALLGRMPKIESRRALRREYQALTDGKESVDRFLGNRARILRDTRLSAGAARRFADTVVGATRVVREGYVKEVDQGQMVEWAVRGLYRKLDEEIPEALAARLARARGMTEREQFALLADVRKGLGKREDLADHKDIDAALLRMLSHLDPYTTFYTPEEVKRAEEEASGQFIGVGIEIDRDAGTDQLRVVTPIKDSPAHRAGVQAGDVITALTLLADDKGHALDRPKVIPTKGLTVSEAVKTITGPPGTKLRLTVRRPGAAELIEFELERRAVQTESVFGVRRRADAGWDYWIDPARRIAYVRLAQFQANSTHEMAVALAELSKDGVKGLVLDLRDNPGGLLDCAREITDLFIDDGVIVEIRPRAGEPEVLRGQRVSTYVREDADGGRQRLLPLPSYTEFPMAVLINGDSASASEIVSAALQDHQRALVVGERSYGKGSVQEVVDFEKEGEEVKSRIKLTTASFWRPSKKNLNRASTPGRPEDEWGVTPDRVVALSPAEQFELFEHQRDAEVIRPKGAAGGAGAAPCKDRQLDAALEYVRGRVK